MSPGATTSIPSSSSSATRSTRQAFHPTMPKACTRSSRSGRPSSPAAARYRITIPVTYLGTRNASFIRRRDLDELGELRLRQRRVDEFELDRIALDARHVLHLVGLQRLLGVKFFDQARDQIPVELHLLRIHVDRLGIRVHPVDRLAVARNETQDRVFLVLQRIRVDDDGAHRLPAQRRRLVAADENADFAFLELLHAERRGRPADVDLAGHDLVSVPAGPPVAVGLAFTPSSSMKASTRLLELEPLVE